LQRTDLFFLDQFLDLRNLKLPAGHDFPQAKITFLTLKFFVVLMDLAAAQWARNPERAEIAGNSVAIMTLGFLDDVASHVRDFFHELGPLHLAARHAAQLELPIARQLRR